MEIAAIPGPKSIEESGVRRNLLEDLALKNLHLAGEVSLHELARGMGLNLRVIEILFERLRKDQLCQVTGMDGNIHRITTSGTGKSRALELLVRNQYSGPAPVSMEDYSNRIRAQSVHGLMITPKHLRTAFEDLVIEDNMLNQLGTALFSGQSLFLYGPMGTGKSIVAQTLARLFEADCVWVPYAVEVDGQIITVYDPVSHKKVEQPKVLDHDGRWVLCRRPHVLVGCELTSEMLDLQFNADSKFYTGPVQMKANNGMLIVDDFGRQRITPEALLNRWVVPLERRMDSLTLSGGKKVEVPFDLFAIFATSLDPAKTMDEAFLRRIQTKIRFGFATPVQFHEISRRVCAQFNLKYDSAVMDELILMIRRDYKEPLRACHPRDILQQILWSARYAQQEPALDRDSVALACRNYFVAPEPEAKTTAVEWREASGLGSYEPLKDHPVVAGGMVGSVASPSATITSDMCITKTPIPFGPLSPLMDDKSVTDILIDSFDKIYVERKGKLESTGLRFETETRLRELIDSILATVGRRVDATLPMADARLPDGSRVNVIIPPLAIDGLSLSIRRFRKDALQLEDLIELKTATAEMGELLKGIVRARLNVLVSGGTGSGKTTLLNVLSGFIPSNERIISIEDSAELQLKQEYVVRLETRPPDLEGKGEIVQRDLVKNSLRMRPDRIVVGEVRGAEVLDMLQAMNTGHDGSLSTIHANSPRDALTRLETLVAMSGLSIPHEAVRKQIASAIDIIIQVARLGDGSRKLVSLQEINGMEGNIITMQEFFRFEQTGVAADGSVKGRFKSGGFRPKFTEKFEKLGIEIPGVIFDPYGAIEI